MILEALGGGARNIQDHFTIRLQWTSVTKEGLDLEGSWAGRALENSTSCCLIMARPNRPETLRSWSNYGGSFDRRLPTQRNLTITTDIGLGPSVPDLRPLARDGRGATLWR